MKKLLSLLVVVALVLTLSGCWSGEIAVDTVINEDGSGTRTIVLAVMDDTLSTDPITNPDDPDGTEGKGAVINNQHITGGLPEIQTWLEANSPTWMTVEEMETDGIYRNFTLTYDFTDFDDFLAKYEELVDLSPNLAWTDFAEDEQPTLVCDGTYKVNCTFNESIDLVNASLDWAVDGIWNDIYDEATLAGWVGKGDISVLANYTVTLGDQTVEELQFYDPDAIDGEGTGATVYPQGNWEVAAEFTGVTAITLTVLGAAVVVGGAVFAVIKFKK